uniref:Uncharacterized protein n=1 Tax=Anopheles coluzzii TaxID=1518534 RepID=A0A8W7P105_ANOCL
MKLTKNQHLEAAVHCNAVLMAHLGPALLPLGFVIAAGHYPAKVTINTMQRGLHAKGLNRLPSCRDRISLGDGEPELGDGLEAGCPCGGGVRGLWPAAAATASEAVCCRKPGGICGGHWPPVACQSPRLSAPRLAGANVLCGTRTMLSEKERKYRDTTVANKGLVPATPIHY